MKKRALLFQFRGDGIPKQLESNPLFRYDDVPRGYLDGAVWRLGGKGRPFAIVTTELHPRYGMQSSGKNNPKIVYDLLSFHERGFSSSSPDVSWSPVESATEMKRIVKLAPKVADSDTKRLIQLRQLARRFLAYQHVKEEGFGDERVVLRLLPKNIDRYQPTQNEKSDGAIFLFVNGRMPGILMLLETDGEHWQYGFARLSAPSIMSVALDGDNVWQVGRDFGSTSGPYLATNADISIPGVPE